MRIERETAITIVMTVNEAANLKAALYDYLKLVDSSENTPAIREAETAYHYLTNELGDTGR